ncbi:MAG: hypothetical protein AAF677_06125 [Pseudomonadota bacterium]
MRTPKIRRRVLCRRCSMSGFVGDQTGAMTLDWMSITAGALIAGAVTLGVVASDAMGLVSDLSIQDSAERQAMQLSAPGPATIEPGSKMAPSAIAAGSAGPRVAATTDFAVVLPSDAGGGGAFEPAIAEPEAKADPTVGLMAPIPVDAASGGTSDVVREAQDDCVIEIDSAANPFVTGSLLQNEACDLALEAVIAEPGQVETAGLPMPTFAPAEQGSAQAAGLVAATDAVAPCEDAPANNPFVTDSLLASGKCAFKEVEHDIVEPASAEPALPTLAVPTVAAPTLAVPSVDAGRKAPDAAVSVDCSALREGNPWIGGSLRDSGACD